MAAQNKGFGLLFEMGCGKTVTAIAVMGVGYKQRKINRVLIVAPSSVCSVWPDELDRFAAFPYRAAVLLGTKKARLAALSELKADKTEALKVAVINYDSVWRDGIAEALQAWEPDMIIADESQRIKTPTIAASKAMHKLGDNAPYKLILSGTPVQNNAIDLWSQYRFMDPSVFGPNYWAFRGRYAIMGGYERHKIVGYRNLDELVQKEYSVAYRVTKAEALDLPEQTFEHRLVTLEPSAQSIYDKVRRDSFAELAGGGVVTATTALTRLLRLQQIAGGFLQADDGSATQSVSMAKRDALSDILEDYVIATGKKLVIFARFLAELKLITALLDSKGIHYGLIHGAVPMGQRGEIVNDFQSNPETKVFVAQIDTAGLGITLTAADTCVYYSVNFNYAAYEQSLSRIHRIGQRNTCTYIHLVARGTVDSYILAALDKKKDLARLIVDNWREIFAA
ncbi:MAG: DEAD/DEAH box helicase [Clostridia bacterium]|nr:DEAD/DEAH box helicase [Clostridia bacterium]